MDKSVNNGRKIFSKFIVGNQPVLLSDGSRWEVTMQLESGAQVRVGATGTVGGANGVGYLLMTTGAVLFDKSSGDAWWGATALAGTSGTVNVYVVD
jgi:hypothetical protein